MKFMWIMNFSLAWAVAIPVQAQSVKSVITASNGVEVTVYSDEFANRYEYTAPLIKTDDVNVLVGNVKKSGVTPAPHLTGFVIYSGEWRRYNSALFKGGDKANFIETGKDVGRCYSSRYSRPSCTLTENFRIELSPAEIKKHSQYGKIALQIRALDSSATIIEVPMTYIDAVNEVANR
ncbi:hypothetical protein [Sphingosinicella sp.]|uniref:hypothetical protein n=1 Tax=Sphingosinicella sp. TaxID=1917971 RepID=UPI00182892ED|nr:hypothetical protein [Sphingosinicella sp.]MBA4760015.1 hypothetical protein [Sphingosinicella sp.]